MNGEETEGIGERTEDIRGNQESLYELGFTVAQIERLSQFRKDYIEREQQEIEAELRRLEFLRWLVVTGRLTA
jgi:hypothetical protein